MEFSKVVFDKSVSSDVARVNRQTGVLYLNPDIWERLTPDEREFVLLHENGHLVLQTADEYRANRYAVSKFLPVQKLSNTELGKRIQVVSEVTDSRRYMSSYNGADPVGAIADGIGSIFKSLPMLGIGSKARQKEAAALAENQMKLADKLATNRQTLIMAGGLMVVVIMVLYFTFKK